MLTDVLFVGDTARMNVFFNGDPTLSFLGPEGREQFSPSSWDGFPPAPGEGSPRRPALPPMTAGARIGAASTSYRAATPPARRRR
ncbi:hypothetical protein CCS38_20250 [Streptomyces purpurogeneiscleroticus]|nr:hypothetical protein [Streptomyces purpurogeneiscleroticus]